jgi:hypothetical protein
MKQGAEIYDETSVSVGGSLYQLRKFMFGIGCMYATIEKGRKDKYTRT